MFVNRPLFCWVLSFPDHFRGRENGRGDKQSASAYRTTYIISEISIDAITAIMPGDKSADKCLWAVEHPLVWMRYSASLGSSDLRSFGNWPRFHP